MRTRNIAVEIISVLFIILWVYAGLTKLLDYETFKFQLSRSPYIQNIAGVVAWILPVGEMLIALMLIIKPVRIFGLYASFFLMLLFTGYIYTMLHYSPYLPCSCGGILSKMSWGQHLYFNAIYTLLGLIGIALSVIKPASHLNILKQQS